MNSSEQTNNENTEENTDVETDQKNNRNPGENQISMEIVKNEGQKVLQRNNGNHKTVLNKQRYQKSGKD